MHLITLTNNWRYFTQHRQHVVRFVARKGHRVVVIGPEANSLDASPDDGVHFETAPILGQVSLWSDVRALRVIWQHIKQAKDPLLHAITMKPILLALMMAPLWRWFGGGKVLPVIVTFPGLGYIFAPSSRGTLMGWLRYRLVSLFLWMFLRGTHLWATFETQQDLEFLKSVTSLCDEQLILISGTGVDLEVFYPGANHPDPKPEGDGLRVLFAGRLLRSKGIMAFVAVAERLAATGISFEVAGWEYDSPDGLTQEEIIRLTQNQWVRYHGFVEDMPSLLREVDAVLLPSSYPEGIPKIFLEAAASALPIISTDFAGARQVIVDGETGFLINDPSVEQIEAALKVLAARPDRGRLMGDKALERIKEGQFSEADIQKQFWNVMERALQKAV